MALRDFSGGYYSLDMRVEPYADGPVIDASLYNYINREIYYQTNAPITMKLSLDTGEYFGVDGENGVPPEVLALPESWVENFDTSEGERSTIFVLKPQHSSIMHNVGIGDL